MKFISEDIIYEIVAQLEENDGLFEEKVKALGIKQPNILAYVISDEFKILTDTEREFLLYTTTVITTAILENETIPVVKQETIGAMEESNWEIFQTQKGTFRERLDVFFENYPQEDLLAFVEDSLFVEDDETDEVMTKVGRDVIFIALRSIIDVLVSNNSDQ